MVGCTPMVSFAEVAGDCEDFNPTVSPGRAERSCNGMDDDCDGEIDEGDPVRQTYYPDDDGDGYRSGEGGVLACVAPLFYLPASASTDCDDNDGRAAPGREEVCDGIDNDCDGTIDQGLLGGAPTWYPDSDGDGFTLDTGAMVACAEPPGFAALSVELDCDDDHSSVYPGAEDLCDGLDNDCDTDIDEDAVDLIEWGEDVDGDGYGGEPYTLACAQPEGLSPAGDCNEGDPRIHPGAEEVCNGGVDDDCDGMPMAGGEVDTDYDGWLECEDPDGDGVSATDGDCAPLDPSTHPGAVELCDGIDNDCNGTYDEGHESEWSAYCPDVDQDGYPLCGDVVQACFAPQGFVAADVAQDCDDVDAGVHPDADETCNGLDDDCDVDVDEEPIDGAAYAQDQDGDGVGGSEIVYACTLPTDHVPAALGVDCDDTDPTRSPLRTELCNELDDDCDGVADEGLDYPVWYLDADNDGFGDEDTVVASCFPPLHFVAIPGDCDDDNGSVSPGGTDVCEDGIDQDCRDGDLDCVGTDSDGDGFCGAEVSCSDGTLPGDCDDQLKEVNPAAAEACNGFDDNCNGEVDEGITTDFDEDGFTEIGSCYGSADDCNDANPDVNVIANEACNLIDDDCDGAVDENLTFDEDEDGWLSVDSCPPGSAGKDCDDTDPSVHPDAEEIAGNGIDENCNGLFSEDPTRIDRDGDGCCEALSCDDGSLPGDCDDDDPAQSCLGWEIIDGKDNDCDGSVDELDDVSDLDGDGVSQADGDCNDLDKDIYPGADERCNGIDDNCDGALNSDEADADFDGVLVCEGDCDDNDPTARPGIAEDCYDDIDNNCDGNIDEDADRDGDGWTTCGGDCGDGDAAVFPGAPERCNDIDDDCDGLADEGFDGDQDGVPSCALCEALVAECDCDDSNALRRPGLAEVCDDGIDNNCNELVDELTDDDGDLFSTCDGDCNDLDSTIHPAATERCDQIDNNCNLEVDEGLDLDGDGFLTCTGDCDEGDPDIWFGQVEACDGVDNDCDGVVDDDFDLDGDGFPGSCGDDCDDADAAIFPGAVEECNGEDDDCDDVVDDGLQCDTGDTALDVVDTQDTDGVVDTGSKRPREVVLPSAWFCSSTGSSPWTMWPIAIALAVARRRARSPA